MKKLGQMVAFEPLEECSPDDPEEEAATQFDYNFYKNMWYSRKDVLVEATVNDGTLSDKVTPIKKAIFKIDSTSYDNLSKCQIIVPFSSVKVKDKYRTGSKNAMIAWTEYPLINYIIDVQLKLGDTVIIDPFDTIWLMNHLIWNTPTSDMDIVNHSIGNRPSMLNWSYSISGQTCYHKLPFGYSYSQSSSLPLYLFNSQAQLTKVITYYKNPVEKLLRMKVTKDGDNWKHVPASSEMLEYSEFLPPTLKLSYHKILESEKSKIMSRDVIVIPMHSVTSFTGKNRKQAGDADPIAMTTTRPVLGIFAVSRNLEAETLNIRSNFTNNIYNPHEGSSPISDFYMNYDTVTRFSETSDSMISDSMLSHFQNVPKRGGYIAFPYSQRPFSTSYMVGPNLNSDLKAVLTVKYDGQYQRAETPEEILLQDDENDIISRLLEKESKGDFKSERYYNHTDENTYITEVRALIFRDLCFVKNKEGDFRFSIY